MTRSKHCGRELETDYVVSEAYIDEEINMACTSEQIKALRERRVREVVEEVYRRANSASIVEMVNELSDREYLCVPLIYIVVPENQKTGHYARWAMADKDIGGHNWRSSVQYLFACEQSWLLARGRRMLALTEAQRWLYDSRIVVSDRYNPSQQYEISPAKAIVTGYGRQAFQACIEAATSRIRRGQVPIPEKPDRPTRGRPRGSKTKRRMQ